MRVEVYKGGELAALLVYGSAPVYNGTWGRQVRRLLDRPRYVRNPWTGEVRRKPVPDDPEWWLGGIYGAGLAGRGFTLYGPAAPTEVTPAPASPAGEAREHP
jgi:hypothetical protein